MEGVQQLVFGTLPEYQILAGRPDWADTWPDSVLWRVNTRERRAATTEPDAPSEHALRAETRDARLGLPRHSSLRAIGIK